MVTVNGTFDEHPASVTIDGGAITQGQHSNLAAVACGMVAAGAEVVIPGVWAGAASLTDPWAICALFLELMPDAKFYGEAPPSLTAGDEPGTVY